MKRHAPYVGWLWLTAAATVCLVALVLPAQAWAHGPAEGGASSSDIQGLFKITLAIAIPVFLLVEGLIVFAIIRYRRRMKADMPEQVTGNRTLEISWTVLSFAIVFVLFWLTYRALKTDYEVKAGNEDATADLTVRVTGYMFNWDYEYYLGEAEETGVTTTKTLTIPANRNVLLEISSRDVQHSFWVHDLAGKVDAVPGYTNTMWIKADKPGTYKGNCAEYCGTLHYKMLIEVDALEPAAFDAWLADKMAAAGQFVPVGTDMESPLPAGVPADGEQLFTDLGCSNCHGAQPGAGPALSNMHENMEAQKGYTTEQYLRESILMPCNYQVEGYNCNVMPHDFGQKLDRQSLADLIAYLMQTEE